MIEKLVRIRSGPPNPQTADYYLGNSKRNKAHFLANRGYDIGNGVVKDWEQIIAFRDYVIKPRIKLLDAKFKEEPKPLIALAMK